MLLFLSHFLLFLFQPQHVYENNGPGSITQGLENDVYVMGNEYYNDCYWYKNYRLFMLDYHDYHSITLLSLYLLVVLPNQAKRANNMGKIWNMIHFNTEKWFGTWLKKNVLVLTSLLLPAKSPSFRCQLVQLHRKWT